MREQDKKIADIISDLIAEYESTHAELVKVLNENAELTKKLEQAERELSECKESLKAEAANIHAEIASAGTSCHWCMDKTKRDTARECAEIAHTMFDDGINDFTITGEFAGLEICNAIKTKYGI